MRGTSGKFRKMPGSIGRTRFSTTLMCSISGYQKKPAPFISVGFYFLDYR
jgi:hypothetical protein